jgi:hypothetical protein
MELRPPRAAQPVPYRAGCAAWVRLAPFAQPQCTWVPSLSSLPCSHVEESCRRFPFSSVRGAPDEVLAKASQKCVGTGHGSNENLGASG